MANVLCVTVIATIKNSSLPKVKSYGFEELSSICESGNAADFITKEFGNPDALNITFVFDDGSVKEVNLVPSYTGTIFNDMVNAVEAAGLDDDATMLALVYAKGYASSHIIASLRETVKTRISDFFPMKNGRRCYDSCSEEGVECLFRTLHYVLSLCFDDIISEIRNNHDDDLY